jgi:protein-S-isoprenylcysteine O-methyltransferase Ste14
MKQRMIALYILGDLAGLAVAGVALFCSAGRLDWWPAWAVLGVWLAWFLVTHLLLYRRNPELMAERLNPPRSAKNWDRVILSLLRLLQLARYILAGLDQRYGWTVGFPVYVQLAGLVVSLLSYVLLSWAMLSNTFFSQVVRIQTERGHAVASAGPYRYVRHPGCAGMILFELALSALLASWPAILVGVACAGVILLRTVLEDHTLKAELNGYVDYARWVRYRLVPGVW